MNIGRGLGPHRKIDLTKRHDYTNGWERLVAKSKYDFTDNPRAWTFTGEVKTVYRRRSWFDFGPDVEYQLVFEKVDHCVGPVCHTLRIGVTFSDGRAKISDPPAGE